MAASDVENRVLGGLRERLLEPELVQAFLDEYHAELQKLRKDTRRRRRDVEKQRANLKRQIARLDAIADGSVGDVGAVGKKLHELEGRLAALPMSTDEDPSPIEWHPNAVDIYKRSIADLSAVLNADDATRDEAIAAIRTLVDRIVVHPGERRGQFNLELDGQLAAALNLGNHNVGGETGTGF